MIHRTRYESSEGANTNRNHRRVTNQIRDSSYLKTCPQGLNFAFNRDSKKIQNVRFCQYYDWYYYLSYCVLYYTATSYSVLFNRAL